MFEKFLKVLKIEYIEIFLDKKFYEEQYAYFFQNDKKIRINFAYKLLNNLNLKLINQNEVYKFKINKSKLELLIKENKIKILTGGN